MKRLLCIISSMNSGGAETFLMKLYRKLDLSNYQMDFCINVQEECFYSKEIRSLGGKIFYVPAKSADMKGFKRKFIDLVKKEKYDYVLRVASNTTGFFDLKLAKKAGATRCSVRATNSRGSKGILNLLQYVGRLLYSKYIDVKIAPSDLAGEFTFGKKSYQNGDIEILHNAVDLDVYRYSDDDRISIRKEFGIDDSKIVIGHVGRFAKQKNHDFLIDIFAKIHKLDPQALLLLVGGGDLQPEIQKKVETLGLTENVIFAGIRSDIPKMLSAMDLFLFPSFFEGMPNTVIEAQATGLPCIISDTITKEANITGLVEYLSLAMSAEKWAEKALGKLSDTRKNTYSDFVSQGYDIDTVVEKFVKLVFGE